MELTLNQDDAPPNCEHSNWTLGCERCFFEMSAIAKQGVAIADQTVAEAQLEGGALFNWHVITMLDRMVTKLNKESNSALDLGMRSLCASVAVNLQQLGTHLTMIALDPKKLLATLQESSAIMQRVTKRIDDEKAAHAEGRELPPDPAFKPKSTIILTDQF